MSLSGPSSRGFPVPLTLLGLMALLPLCGSVRAAPPMVSISPGSVRIQVTSASLAEAVDALSRAAGFKVTYEGPRPMGMIFNVEINSPSVAETLFRLLDGQNVNYGVVFDLTGRQVASLMVLGPAAKHGGVTTTPASSGAAPRQFAPPRNPRNDLPLVDDDPEEEAEAEPEPPAAVPEATASPSPDPAGSPDPADRRTVPQPPSPFSPRPLVVSPFAPRATPSPSPSP
jgi:hypothetical protein